MKVSVTNLGTVPLPLIIDGNATTVEPQESASVDGDSVGVVTLGVNPSHSEGLSEAMRKIATAWKAWKTQHPQEAEGTEAVRVRIENAGTEAVRVLQGAERERDQRIPPGESFEAAAADYVELRAES